MMDAMMTTNSGKPIGRWPEETRASALTSDTYDLDSGRDPTRIAALHNTQSAHGSPSARDEVAGFARRAMVFWFFE
jgi:hypothetical protein